MAGDIIYTRTGGLHPNALDAKLYGDSEPLDDLLETIRQDGIQTPLLILHDGTVLSGVRRLRAAQQLHLESVPVYYSGLTDPLEIEKQIIICNRQREKTDVQKAREYKELKRIETALAEQRMKAGKSADGTAGGRGHRKQETAFEIRTVPLPTLESGDAHSTRNNGGDIINPVPNLAQGLPAGTKVRDIAAAQVGWSHGTAEKAEAVLDYAEVTGDQSLLTTMQEESVNAAARRLAQKLAAEKGGTMVPELKAQPRILWEVSGPVKGLGLENDPNRLAGDIVRNLYWFYTRTDDTVIALNDPAGVALDAAKALDRQKIGWPLACHSYAPAPRRRDVKRFDFSSRPYLPPGPADVGLVFLDAPEWSPKSPGLGGLPVGQYHQRLLAIMTAAVKTLRPGGAVAVLISVTRGEPARIDHAARLIVQFDAAPLAQQFKVEREIGGHEVATARDQRRILDTYRDLIVFQLPEEAEACPAPKVNSSDGNMHGHPKSVRSGKERKR